MFSKFYRYIRGNVLYATNLITAPNRRDFNYYEIPIVKTFTRDDIPSGLNQVLCS